MRASTFPHRMVTVLCAGAFLLIAGCSAKPEAQPGTTSDVEAKESVPTVPVATVTTVTTDATDAGVETSPTSPSDTAPSAPDTAPHLTVEGEGLRWLLPPNGSARPIPFGAPQSEVLASLEFVLGRAGKGTNEDCGAGPVQFASWPDGLSLVFQDGRFVGWGLGIRAAHAITTAAGIGPGSTRAELGAAYSAAVTQTSLGSEFSAGDLHGVLDGPSAGAKITDMWAGVSCVAR